MLLGRNELNMLDSLNERENAVITALLRCYGGLFPTSATLTKVLWHSKPD